MLRFGLILLILPALALMSAFMMEQNQIRECLAQPGVWDYSMSICESEGKFPFIPFMARFPLWVNGGMLVSVLGLLLTIVGLYRPSRPLSLPKQ